MYFLDLRELVLGEGVVGKDFVELFFRLVGGIDLEFVRIGGGGIFLEAGVFEAVFLELF